MNNSRLVDYIRLSPNCDRPRNALIDFITPHITAAPCTIEALGALFANPQYEASSNYGIDKSGRVGLFVDEQDRSWCSSSVWNDNRAVTIECSSESTEPYMVTDTVFNKLVELCADICKRNGKTRLLWISEKGRALAYPLAKGEMLLTIHRWYANKACPGEYMLSRMKDLAERVTQLLAIEKQPQAGCPYTVVVDCIGLRIRKGASTYTAKVGICPPGIYTIIEEKAGHGSKKGWGRLKSGAGWISLDYAERRD